MGWPCQQGMLWQHIQCCPHHLLGRQTNTRSCLVCMGVEAEPPASAGQLLLSGGTHSLCVTPRPSSSSAQGSPIWYTAAGSANNSLLTFAANTPLPLPVLPPPAAAWQPPPPAPPPAP